MIRFILLLSLLGISSISGQEKEIPCDQLAEQVRLEITKDPARVLLIVEESMKANELCACEIVKTAIVTSKADPQMIKQIVFTAAITAPGLAASIGECALAVAPDFAAQINAGVEEAVGNQVVEAGSADVVPVDPSEEAETSDTASDKSGVALDKSGYAMDKTGYAMDKSPDKDPVAISEPIVDDGGDFGLSPVDIHGVYLIQPVGGVFFPDIGKPISPSTGKPSHCCCVCQDGTKIQLPVAIP